MTVPGYPHHPPAKRRPTRSTSPGTLTTCGQAGATAVHQPRYPHHLRPSRGQPRRRSGRRGQPTSTPRLTLLLLRCLLAGIYLRLCLLLFPYDLLNLPISFLSIAHFLLLFYLVRFAVLASPLSLCRPLCSRGPAFRTRPKSRS